MRRLTAHECKAITSPGFYRCEDTLYLSVKPTGRKSWIQRVMIDGRRHNIGLGSFPVVSLSMARDKAFENRRAITQGRNPLMEKRRATMPTFRKAAVDTHKALAPTFKNPVHVKNWIQVLEKHAIPKLGNIPVDRITQQDILAVLKPIWTEKPETARRVRQRTRTVLRHCQAHGHVQENIADERIDAALPTMPKVKEHRRALDYKDMPEAVRRIETEVASMPTRLCLLFIVYTAVRPNEALEATWTELDFESATWIIPASRMKAKRDHRVPLSRSALAILEQAKPLRNESDLVFPSLIRPHHPMTSRTPMKALEQLGLAEKTVVHGFRTSFRTWAAERTDIPREVCEMALAHNVGNAVEQAYSRSDLLEKRTLLMRHWDGFLNNGQAGLQNP